MEVDRGEEAEAAAAAQEPPSFVNAMHESAKTKTVFKNGLGLGGGGKVEDGEQKSKTTTSLQRIQGLKVK